MTTPLHEQFEKEFHAPETCGYRVGQEYISAVCEWLRTASAQIEKEAYERGRREVVEQYTQWLLDKGFIEWGDEATEHVKNSFLSFLANQEKK